MSYKIALIGEAYGEEEARYNKPFIGKAGEQLNTLLADAGIRREDCFISNVFNLRPQGNGITTLCGGLRDANVIRGLPPLTKGKYLLERHQGELTRLREELAVCKPNVVVCLGNTATWALLGKTNISKIRGTCSLSLGEPQLKVLPTYHPAAILRQYELRHVTVLDLIKAKRSSEFPELRRPVREIWMDPTLADLEDFFEAFLKPAATISVDVETAFQQVTCIGFSPSAGRALVIPFLDYRFSGGHYWKTVEEEVAAWEWVKKALALPADYLAQNGLYDCQFLWRQHGVQLRLAHDTMLLHHALQPESPKSLGFLGSVYTDEVAWKPMRPRSKHMEKPEDSE